MKSPADERGESHANRGLADASATPVEAEAPWRPGKPYSPVPDSPREFRDVRGIIHAHSVYSFDACDGEAREGDSEVGPVNQACLNDFRNDLCTVKHDFVMLTDHDTSFAHQSFPDVLLHDPALGDELVNRGGAPVAGRLQCPDGRSVLVMAGSESKTMPVGLERHVAADVPGREKIYRSAAPEDIEQLKSAGAVVLVAHTEDWTVEQLTGLPLHGFEMYNLHRNLMQNVGKATLMLGELDEPGVLPHPDLALLPLFEEDPVYLDRWGTVLATGAQRVTTLGTDCHRNFIPTKLSDGERVDSYRRMMLWFSNHLRVQPEADGTWDDRHLKDALASGRLYGAFEMLGHPAGFDFYGTAGGSVLEMGDAVGASKGAEITLHVEVPVLRGLSPEAAPPEIQARLLKAVFGGWEVVREGASAFSVTVAEPGAYRSEIRMKPRHLLAHLGEYAELSEQSFPWIYSNAIYVVR